MFSMTAIEELLTQLQNKYENTLLRQPTSEFITPFL